MNLNEIINKIRKDMPNYNILSCYNYDNKYYLFSLSYKSQTTNNDDFYLINKKTGEIKEYPILNDIEKFNQIVMNKNNIIKFKKE